MKKLKLIYNPFSGNKGFKFDLDICISIFQANDYEVHIFRAIREGDIKNHILNMDSDYSIVVVSGGDGSVNIVIDALLTAGLDIPVGIIPAGTANDFASFIGLSGLSTEQYCNIIAEGSPSWVDVGEVNGRYFINVCAGGHFANISQKVDKDFKNALGNLSYFIKALEQLPAFSPIRFSIKGTKLDFVSELYLFLIMNSGRTGNFDKISPDAAIDDGQFEFIGIKAKPMYEIAVLLVKILRGEHIGDSNIIYFKDSYFEIERLSKNIGDSDTDIDGELGPKYPICVTVHNNKLRIFKNNR